MKAALTSQSALVLACGQAVKVELHSKLFAYLHYIQDSSHIIHASGR